MASEPMGKVLGHPRRHVSREPGDDLGAREVHACYRDHGWHRRPRCGSWQAPAGPLLRLRLRRDAQRFADLAEVDQLMIGLDLDDLAKRHAAALLVDAGALPSLRREIAQQGNVTGACKTESRQELVERAVAVSESDHESILVYARQEWVVLMCNAEHAGAPVAG